MQHSGDGLAEGSEAWRLIPELTRGDAEPLVAKRYADAFGETELEPVLAGRGVGRLVVAGAQTDECIRSTLHGAIVYWQNHTAPGRRAGTVTTAAVSFA